MSSPSTAFLLFVIFVSFLLNGMHAEFLALVFEHIALTDKGNWTCEATLTNNNNNEATSAASTPDAGSTATVASGEARRSFELLVNRTFTSVQVYLV